MTLKKFIFLTILVLCTAAHASAQQKSLLKTIYAKVACNIMEEEDGMHICGLACKGDPLLVIRPARTLLDENTVVKTYKVRSMDGTVGYIRAEYLTFDEKEAKTRYNADYFDPLHRESRNRFNGGDPLGADIYPRRKGIAGGKKMPEACYSLYLPATPKVLENMDAYIELAERTMINTFVIDIKEDGLPGFKADAMAKYSPSAYRRAQDNLALYQSIVKRLHAKGIWAVGRIVTFKDYHFTKDNPDCALWDKSTGTMLLHNKSNWPSAYSRKVWEYNVELACEAVRKIGFDEINFDYVRFPDRMNSIEAHIEMRNKYGESKLQAIQRFVTYAVDKIHEEGAYVSIDVFGEAANPGYTTAYGQYWPAISTVADAICGMPYPDHFTNGYYGINKPWNHPYELMKAWGTHVMNRQAETATPAVVRTWVQAYHVMRHVDPNGIDYNAANIEKEIRGLYAAGCTGGYTTWLASGNIDKYRTQAAAFSIDYLREYKQNNPNE